MKIMIPQEYARFGVAVIRILEDDEDWSSDTFDQIMAAMDVGNLKQLYGDCSENGLFRHNCCCPVCRGSS